MRGAARCDRRRAGADTRRPRRRPTRSREARRAAALAGRRPLHLPRLPRVRPARRDGRRGRCCGPCPAPGSASCAPTSRGSGVVRPSCRPRSRAKAREHAAADPHQGQLPLHRAPPGLPRLRRRQDVRRATARWSASAASSGCSPRRPTPSQRAADPGAARARSPRCWSASGFAADSHSGKDLLADPGDLPARRAVPDRRRRAATTSRPSVLHLQERRQTAAVPAPGRLRPVHVLPGLPAARPLHHRRPAADGGASCASALRRRERRLHDAGHRVGAGPAALRRPGRRRAQPIARRRRGRARGAAGRRDPLLGRRPRRGAARRATARRPARACSRALRRRLPRGVQGGLHRRARRVADLRARSRRSAPSDAIGAEPLPAAPAPRPSERRFKLYRAGAPMSLSAVLPRAAATWASRSSTSARTRSTRSDGRAVCDLRLRAAAAAAAGDRTGRRRARAASRTRSPRPGAGEAESDGFNALVLRRRPAPGGRSSCCAPTPSTCARPARPSARTTSSGALRRQRRRSPRLLVELFEARFDPDRSTRRRARATRGRARWSSEIARRARRGRQPGRGPHPARLPRR